MQSTSDAHWPRGKATPSSPTFRSGAAVEMLFLSLFLPHFFCAGKSGRGKPFDPFRLSWGLKVENDENKIKKSRLTAGGLIGSRAEGLVLIRQLSARDNFKFITSQSQNYVFPINVSSFSDINARYSFDLGSWFRAIVLGRAIFCIGSWLWLKRWIPSPVDWDFLFSVFGQLDLLPASPLKVLFSGFWFDSRSPANEARTMDSGKWENWEKLGKWGIGKMVIWWNGDMGHGKVPSPKNAHYLLMQISTNISHLFSNGKQQQKVKCEMWNVATKGVTRFFWYHMIYEIWALLSLPLPLATCHSPLWHTYIYVKFMIFKLVSQQFVLGPSSGTLTFAPWGLPAAQKATRLQWPNIQLWGLQPSSFCVSDFDFGSGFPASAFGLSSSAISISNATHGIVVWGYGCWGDIKLLPFACERQTTKSNASWLKFAIIYLVSVRCIRYRRRPSFVLAEPLTPTTTTTTRTTHLSFAALVK